MKKVITIILALLLDVGVVQAQGEIIVDANGGSDFLTIQDAVDAAQPGDIVRITHGEYQGATVTKGIRILGNPANPGISRVNISSPFEVRSIPGGQSFIASELYSVVNSFELQLQDCEGPVHLDKLAATPRITRCAYVSFSRSSGIGDTFQNPGNPGLIVEDSYVTMTESHWGTAFASSAIRAVRARLVMVKSSGQVLNTRNSANPSPPVVLEDTILTRSVDTQFGVHCPSGAICPPLVEKIGASVDATTNNQSIVIDAEKSELVLRAPPQTPVAVLVSLPGMPVTINQGFTQGTLYLDLPSSLFLFLGQTGFDFLKLPIPVPTGERIGLPLTIQAGILVGNTLKLSHPYTIVY